MDEIDSSREGSLSGRRFEAFNLAEERVLLDPTRIKWLVANGFIAQLPLAGEFEEVPSPDYSFIVAIRIK